MPARTPGMWTCNAHRSGHWSATVHGAFVYSLHPDTTSPYIRGVEGTDRSTHRSGCRGLLNPRSKSTALRTGAVVVVLSVVYAVDCFILEVDSAHAIMVRPRSLGRRRAVPTRMPCKSSTTSTMWRRRSGACGRGCCHRVLHVHVIGVQVRDAITSGPISTRFYFRRTAWVAPQTSQAINYFLACSSIA